MIFEIVSTSLLGGIAGFSYYKKSSLSNDKEKIQKICLNCGLTVKEGGDTKTIQLYRKKKHDWGMEYVYKIPLGLSFNDFEKKIHHLKDGINVKRSFIDISLNDLKSINLKENIIQQIKEIIEKKKHFEKDVELRYDGMLRIRVLEKQLPTFLKFDEDMWLKCNGWEVPLGQSRYEFINHDLEHGHITLAGATRKGKTVLLKLLITSIINLQPENVKLTLIDLKGGLSFTRFKNAKQVHEVASNVDEALDALRDLQKELYDRQKIFEQEGYEDVKEADLKERHFIIVDEAAQLSPNVLTDKGAKKKATECDFILSEIARIGAGLGYRLIYCSQYPTADVMNKQIKQNCDTVITYKLRDAVASRVVLDESGAEKLPIPGRAIYKTPDGVKVIQTPYIENDFIDKTVKPHIVIKPRKEKESDKVEYKEREEGGSNSFIIEEA